MKNLALSLTGAFCAASTVFGGTLTTEPSYLNGTTNGDFDFKALVTVGDRVPLTGGAPTDSYVMAGIPDAMGIYRDRRTGERVLFLAHELTSGTTTEPLPGQPFLKGAFVSRYSLDSDASIISGGLAHRDLYLENTLVANTPPLATDANAFTRFCSGAFAGPAQGFDRPMFLTNEESGSGNYDAAGSQAVAIVDGAMRTLPDLGRVARETTTVMPRRDAFSAVIMTEDAGFPSYVYMYVGTKQRRSASPLDKNGLTNGRIYVLGGRGANAGSNASVFTNGSIDSRWIEIPNAASLDADDLKVAADAVGGFGFVRVEDCEFDPIDPTRGMFIGATGGFGPSNLGRLYKVNFNPRNPTADGTLDLIYNADQIVTPGGTMNNAYTGPFFTANGGAQVEPTYTGGDLNAGSDFPVSIDNIAVTRDKIVICEDRNNPASAVFAKYLRNGGVWSLDRNANFAAKYQADFNFSYVNSRDSSTPSVRGVWEASGVIDSSELFGPGSFVINVQAHDADRTNIPNGTGGTYTRAEANTRFREDGQVILMTLK